MKSLEGFGMIQTFINLPLFFLSGSLFPLSIVPSTLRWITYIDPSPTASTLSGPS